MLQIAAELDTRANAGDPIAEFRLSILYPVGKGVSGDYSHAESLPSASQESGLAEAQYHHGMMCDKGQSVARDASEARCYVKAARRPCARGTKISGMPMPRGQVWSVICRKRRAGFAVPPTPGRSTPRVYVRARRRSRETQN